jgi:hypothetical protein
LIKNNCQGDKNAMKNGSMLPPIAAASICSMLLGFSPESEAATATNLVTICLSATTTTQASKCTKWSYNVYSPAAYIESYPQVSPGPAVWTDPNYDYRLGSTVTPTMGVKVCPTSLTPGVTFSSANADPCPNNVMVSASTVLPASSYAIGTNPGGIVVYQVSTSGVSEVAGSPFVPSPLPSSVYPNSGQPFPYLTALDPTGQYLYAAYDVGETGGSVIYSFKMVGGVPQQLSNTGDFGGGCGGCDGEWGTIVATAQHVYGNFYPNRAIPLITIFTTTNGVLTGPFFINLPMNLPTTSPEGYDSSIGFTVDPTEQFLYWYLSSTGGTTSDTIAIYSLNFANSTATFVQAVSQTGTVLSGAK